MRIAEHKYKCGDLVLKRVKGVEPGRCKKLQALWHGPWVVVEAISPALYKIKDRRRTAIVHHDMIKECRDRVIPRWVSALKRELGIEDIQAESVFSSGSVASSDGEDANRGSDIEYEEEIDGGLGEAAALEDDAGIGGDLPDLYGRNDGDETFVYDGGSGRRKRKPRRYDDFLRWDELDV